MHLNCLDLLNLAQHRIMEDNPYRTGKMHTCTPASRPGKCLCNCSPAKDLRNLPRQGRSARIHPPDKLCPLLSSRYGWCRPIAPYREICHIERQPSNLPCLHRRAVPPRTRALNRSTLGSASWCVYSRKFMLKQEVFKPSSFNTLGAS